MGRFGGTQQVNVDVTLYSISPCQVDSVDYGWRWWWSSTVIRMMMMMLIMVILFMAILVMMMRRMMMLMMMMKLVRVMAYGLGIMHSCPALHLPSSLLYTTNHHKIIIILIIIMVISFKSWWYWWCLVALLYENNYEFHHYGEHDHIDNGQVMINIISTLLIITDLQSTDTLK